VLAQEVFDQRGGLDVVRGLIDGALPLPPASYLLGARPIAAEEGPCTFSMPASPRFISPLGSIEGGVIACLADLALASASGLVLAGRRAHLGPAAPFG